MIYRIQTLHLFFSFIIASFSAAYNFLQPVDPEIFQISWVQNHFPGRFFTLSGVFSLLSLVFFKKRIPQLKINRFNILLNIVFIFVFLYFLSQKSLSNPSYGYMINICISIVLIVFLLLASKFIRKDESLIKSVDRIR
ncbi:DUF4293 family protein [Bacteroidetes bacterium endosymbiont of Geopemphigus sp.]|uniref:DUF4293 family protein n=1 Tax=Bacteroidetes bacterium endosymbiont of Geopemphigus sp. TaxID=2047937 RepID=UPI000CD0B83B